MTWAERVVGRPSMDDRAELLRVGRAGSAVCERGRHGGSDADPGFAVAVFEDVGEVTGRGEPRGDDRLRGRQRVGPPGEVLADHVADGGPGDVAGCADAVHRGLACGGYVGEVVREDQFGAVACGRLFQLW